MQLTPIRVGFEVEFLEEAFNFLNGLGEKEREKAIYNIDKSSIRQDPELFKKLTNNIWEFRTLYNSKCIRLFAFWHYTHHQQKLIIATHGIIKKSNKTPRQEIDKAERIRKAFIASENQ